jgi:LysR family transcriptional activator of nhaA
MQMREGSVDHREKTLIKQSVSIYGAPSFKHLRKNFPKSVSGQPFVLPTYDSNLRYKIEYWAKMNEVNMVIVAETQDISLKKLMCIEQLGLIPAAKHTVQRQIQSGDLVEIGKLKGISEELFLISAERKISNPFASKLMKSFVIQQNS